MSPGGWWMVYGVGILDLVKEEREGQTALKAAR